MLSGIKFVGLGIAEAQALLLHPVTPVNFQCGKAASNRSVAFDPFHRAKNMILYHATGQRHVISDAEEFVALYGLEGEQSFVALRAPCCAALFFLPLLPLLSCDSLLVS